MNRIREGRVIWTNPFGGRRHETSLRPEAVAAVVFWSKDFGPLISHLDELDRRGYRIAFQFTITGLPSVFEPRSPETSRATATARLLAERYSPDAVLWRYDPVLISSLTPPTYHVKRFAELAAALEGCSHRCSFSFPTFYAKVVRNLSRLSAETGVTCENPPFEERLELASRLAEIAAQHGIELHACCDDSLVRGPIRKASCVDAELLARLYPDRVGPVAVRPTRKQCGCCESKDIGAYDTCLHGCVYCYANASKETAEQRWRQHDPSAEALV